MIRVKTLPLAGIVLTLMLGGILLSMSLNLWRTESVKTPVKFSTGEFAGESNPADIRGSYTWLDLERVFGLSASEAAAAFSPGNQTLSPSSRVSDLEVLYAGRLAPDTEIGTDSTRLFVSLFLGIPYEPEEGTVLPPRAVSYLAERGKLDAAGAERWTAVISAASPAASAGEPTETHEKEERFISGQTTIADLYAWGLSEAEIVGALGFEPKERFENLRTAVTAVGGSFGTIKTTLQALIDEKAAQ